MKLLIIEDETELRRMMAEALRDAGYVVETVKTYADADEKLHLYEYDCILLDLMLPDGNGLDLLKMLSARGSASRVIITSAKDSVEDKVEGLEFRRQFNIVHHQEKFLTASARAFIELCRSYEMDYPLPQFSGL